MIERLSFHPEAESELYEAIDWYEKRSPGLGLAFRDSVESCINSIRINPQIYPEIYNNIRRALVKRFPYGIFYKHHEDQINIFSIFHAKRNPNIWQRRLN